jgi:hypothetical protein
MTQVRARPGALEAYRCRQWGSCLAQYGACCKKQGITIGYAAPSGRLKADRREQTFPVPTEDVS